MVMEDYVDIRFPDGRVFRAWARLLSIPYGTQQNRNDTDLMCGGFLRMDMEAESASQFRAMSWDDRIKAMRELEWDPLIAAWLLPVESGMTVGDALNRTGKDLDTSERPFTYTADDWKQVEFVRQTLPM